MAMRFLNLGDLCLVEQPVKSKSKKTKANVQQTNVNHILIYDRSYSMFHELKQLGDDLVEKIKELPPGDSVTLGWFSGETQFNFILKGFKITDKKDFGVLEKTIKANISPVGCTCFSEILTNTNQVIKDLSALSTDFSLTFFTDGYPVVSNYEKEISQIKEAIDSIEGRVASGLFVGYGNYYNKNLMTEMSNRLGGSLIHCSSLPEYKTNLGEFMTQASENGSKVTVKLETDTKKSDLVFGIKNQVIAAYNVASDNTVSFSPKKTGDSFVYILTKQRPSAAKPVSLNRDFIESSDRLIKAAYASTLLLTQKAKSDVALEVLGRLGDKALIDRVNNAFTLEEYGKAEAYIKRAVTDRNYRLIDGCDISYLPPKDAFCVLDAIDILLQDEESFFYPNHKEFAYKRVGVEAKQLESYPTFTPDYTVACPFSSLTWNKTKLNLSITTKIPGTIEFKEGYAEQGFQKNMPTFIHRNYAIIKDGFLNVGRIPVKLSSATLSEFKKRRLIERGVDDVNLLCLERLPVINRSIADGKTSAKELCRIAYKEVVLQAELKALKFLRNEIEPASDAIKNDFLSSGQIEYLAENGITKNGFSPKYKPRESVDSYPAKEFNIKIKGLSSLPDIKTVREKLKSGKHLTASAQLIHDGLRVFTFTNDKPARVKLVVLDEYIQQRKKDLFKLRKDLQRTKFSVLLASKWFDEFDSRDNCTLEVDGNHFTLEVREVNVPI